ncbi:hypothetical protein [Dorea sp. AGR2135]|uniref:hypothetical protein n=1 Tax=Dorea sp. AGR2135 TaxID=1280669 RepID=UPI003FA4A954
MSTTTGCQGKYHNRCEKCTYDFLFHRLTSFFRCIYNICLYYIKCFNFGLSFCNKNWCYTTPSVILHQFSYISTLFSLYFQSILLIRYCSLILFCTLILIKFCLALL